MLCVSAVDAANKYGFDNSMPPRRRAILINYDSLPGIIGHILLPFFGVTPSTTWLQKMTIESTNYSKGRSTSKTFVTDSFDKESRATPEIRSYSELLLEPVFRKLENLSYLAFQNLSLNAHLSNGNVHWKSLKEIPFQLNLESVQLSKLRSRKFNADNLSDTFSTIRHSLIPKIEYHPSMPFGNSHRSRRFEVFTLYRSYYLLNIYVIYE